MAPQTPRSLCGAAELNRHLPPGFTAADASGSIQFASDIVLTKLYPRYWPFPEWSSDSSELQPPLVVQEITGKLGAVRELEGLATTNAKRKGRIVEKLREEAMEALTELQQGPETPGGASILPVTVTETLALGVGSSVIGSNDHILNPYGADLEGFHLFRESMEIDGYEWQVDFDAEFVDSLRKWVVNAPTAADGETITYRFHYYRYREFATPVSSGAIKLVRI